MTALEVLGAAGLGLGLASPLAGAQLSPPPMRTVQVGAADLFTIADQFTARGERAQADRILGLLSRDPSREVRNEARYRRSLLSEADGALPAAAVLLRTILDEKPDADAVRLKLATILHRMGDDDSALRELRALRASDLPPAVARFVDRLSASLQASRPFGIQLELAFAPDSNINRATRSDTLGTILGDFTLDENAKRKSGIGAAVRAVAHRRLSLGREFSLVGRATTDMDLYGHSRFNDISAEVSAGPEFRLLGIRVTADAGLAQRWYGMKPYQRQLRISGSASLAVDRVSQARGYASIRHSNALINDFQDGRGLTLRGQYERALSPRMSLGATITTDRFKARDDAYSTRSWTVGVTASRDAGPTTLTLAAEIGRLKADDRLALLPDVRRDKLSRLSVSAVFRRFTVAGFAPMTRITFERNRSTVEFYDYQRTRTEFGVSRAF